MSRSLDCVPEVCRNALLDAPYLGGEFVPCNFGQLLEYVALPQGGTQARSTKNIRRVSSRSTLLPREAACPRSRRLFAMTAKGAHATLEVSVPTATSFIEIDIPNRSFRSLPQHVQGTAQTP